MIDWSVIRQEYEQGSSLRVLAAKHGVGKSTIAERKFKEQWDKPDIGHRTPDTGRKISTSQHSSDSNKKDLSTKDRQRLFLDAFSEHANVLVSARAAGIHRSTVYDWLEHDEDFSFAYNQAKEDAKDVLRAEIYQRGKEGWDESIYEMGVLTKTVRKHSDTLLIFHAKMLMPEYREKSTLDVTTADPLAQALQALSDEQLAQFKQWVIDGRRHDGTS